MIGPSQMKLKGRIRLEDNHSLTFIGQLADGSLFEAPVDQFDVEMNEEFKPSKRLVDGWIYVQAEAQQGSSVYLTLPKPTIQHGKQITVKELQLMPRHVSIKDFGPKTSKDSKAMVEGSTKIPAPVPLVESKFPDYDPITNDSTNEDNKEFDDWINSQTNLQN